MFDFKNWRVCKNQRVWRLQFVESERIVHTFLLSGLCQFAEAAPFGFSILICYVKYKIYIDFITRKYQKILYILSSETRSVQEDV